MQIARSENESQPGLSGKAPTIVLIVDDSRGIVQSLSLMFEAAGCTAHGAYDGKEAVALAEKLRPDIILLDINMPTLDGFNACRQIREQSWGGAMRIIALTGLGHDDDLTNSRKAGFDMHLVKPVDPEILLTVLMGSSGGMPDS
jgi:DNA-binding response OmpR family regulator